ncbi:hypothetical protein [Paracoccus angustae]
MRGQAPSRPDEFQSWSAAPVRISKGGKFVSPNADEPVGRRRAFAPGIRVASTDHRN